MVELIKPKDFSVLDEDGKERNYILSKFDAVTGREILSVYTTSALPKLGEYPDNEQIMFKLMSFVAVAQENGVPLRLSTRALLVNHVPDCATLFLIEKEMMKYNYSFFRDGRPLTLFDDLTQKFLKRISEILIPSSAPSSPTSAQPSTNSEQSTA